MGVDYPKVGYFNFRRHSEVDGAHRYRNPALQARRKTLQNLDSGGLHLMITPTGGKLWRWKYRFEGAEKLMALGRYPDISLAEARERRDAARKRLANGIDPMVERKTRKPLSGKRPNTL